MLWAYTLGYKRKCCIEIDSSHYQVMLLYIDSCCKVASSRPFYVLSNFVPFCPKYPIIKHLISKCEFVKVPGKITKRMMFILFTLPKI